ncbi:hypothetical protein GCM10010994_13050 [Chelatococcus reniformis]|uniref:FAD assembly factor SdhE n=2 Tax=Chelatococcus reniformis TaxID=1494448 RepID=A0A916U1H7_9HYPH|nr:hypothetical protein GCM10010994_13050 [Chelatococcus reniformis]
MGQFVDAEIESLSDGDLDELERLIEVPDRDVFGWVTGENETPGNYRSAVLERLRAFHSHSAPVHL